MKFFKTIWKFTPLFHTKQIILESGSDKTILCISIIISQNKSTVKNNLTKMEIPWRDPIALQRTALSPV